MGDVSEGVSEQNCSEKQELGVNCGCCSREDCVILAPCSVANGWFLLARTLYPALLETITSSKEQGSVVACLLQMKIPHL